MHVYTRRVRRNAHPIDSHPAAIAKRVALRIPQVALGGGIAICGALLSFKLAVIQPYFLNMFWQIPDGLAMLAGHFPRVVAGAIASGPLVNQEWLYEVALAACARAHAYGEFVLICALAAAATPLLAYAAARVSGAGDVAAGIVAFLVVGSRFNGSALRAETFAVDAFALLVIIAFSQRSVLWIGLVVAIWANVHASVIVAPVALGALACGAWIASGRIDARVRRLGLAVVVASAALLVNPYGAGLVAYAVDLAVRPNLVRASLDAWKPISFGVAGNVLAVLPGLLLLMVCGIDRRRGNAPSIVLAALFFFLTLQHGRNAMFLVVAWAPLIAHAIARLRPLEAFELRRPAASVVALVPMVALAFVGVPGAARAPVEPRGAWNAGAEIVRAHHLHGNTYAPYVWAAYLHWQQLPVQLLIDAHGDPYPTDVWADSLALESARPVWRDVVRRRALDIVLAASDSPLAAVLNEAPDWRRVDERDGVSGFVRRSAPR